MHIGVNLKGSIFMDIAVISTEVYVQGVYNIIVPQNINHDIILLS